MIHTWLLAQNTFRESLRDRLLSTLMFFGGIFVCASVVVAPLTLGQQDRIIRDLGLSSVAIFTILMIVMVGTGMVYREIERKTIHTILTQPVGRPSFILGKFLGLYGTVLVAIATLSAFWLGVVGLFGGGLHLYLFEAIAMVAMEAAIVTAVAIFFSSIASPLLSAVFTFLVWISGHLAHDLKMLTARAENPILDFVVEGLYLVLPSLHHFHVRNNILSGANLSQDQMLWGFAYCCLYCIAVLILTVLAFARRDFE
ncbi:MAG: ABC transporter permease [bacterium]|nr:ABC transporter permease [Gemmatimonadota bacterium]